ncbi:MAG TPA: ribosome biogenesis GTPase Der [Anaerolineales bacterium]|nr:ribosome biogenesis GTPase Der [Anaerolineales bacterium]
MTRPVVALVGRPNVGKSALFNRIAGERLAVVDDRPGTTRDRIIAEAEWNGIVFDLVDTGGLDPQIGRRQEPLSIDSADYLESIRVQAEIACREADAVLFLVDGVDGVTPADAEVAAFLRRQRRDEAQPAIFLVVNKCDTAERRQQATEFYELGMGDPIPISALHGVGIGDLLDALTAGLPQSTAELDTGIRIAIVGRPNVGKSSLLNRLLGEERVIVSPLPGTTRDAIDTQLTYHGVRLTLIDTAGIRRRGRITPGVEKYSVLRTLKAIERAQVVLLLIDASEGLTAQDSHIAGMIIEKHRPVVLLVNKWDAVEKDERTMDAYRKTLQAQLGFLDFAPVLFISALTGQRIHQVLPLALRVQEESVRRVPTSQLNRLLAEAVERHPPPARAGRQLKLYFAAQVRTAPPTFEFQANDPELVHFTYVRFLENQIRERFSFLGTPIHMRFRKRE